ncbi:MAG: phosphoribosylformylglycinamidine synthase I, partial [Candidatus Aenigmarchaeota archaeon]|nr:phosphoribosylformylglycinamidine synthase I [Candidatus Aenigmarchaeota archaeon]
MVKTIVLRVDGTNCDEESCQAFRLAGSEVDLVHINELKNKFLEDYQILMVPGGFSYGDDISAGKIQANMMKHSIGDQLKKFVEDGKLVLGICNGFQALVKAGLIPAIDGIMQRQEATLVMNDSGYFMDKWIRLRHVNKGKCIFTKGIKQEIFIPINHGEGKFMAPPEILRNLEENDQLVFKYADNPNGSVMDIAGICNPEGNVFGMMPHPEKYVHPYTHPFWTRMEKLPEEGDG